MLIREGRKKRAPSISGDGHKGGKEAGVTGPNGTAIPRHSDTEAQRQGLSPEQAPSGATAPIDKRSPVAVFFRSGPRCQIATCCQKACYG
jgi:hypothetical protein